MALREISIPVTTEVANAYSHASEAERNLAIRVFANFISPRSKLEAAAEFHAARGRLNEEAKASGLTPEELQGILSDDK